MMINVSLKFENLLNTALLDWPKNFILDTLVNQKQFVENIFGTEFIKDALEISQEELDNKYPNYYLFDLHEFISYQTFYFPEHIMLSNIHYTIFGVIRKSKFYGGNYTIKQVLSTIDSFNQIVRNDFEIRIYDLLSSHLNQTNEEYSVFLSHFDWTNEDIKLIKQYFEVNNVDMNSIS